MNRFFPFEGFEIIYDKHHIKAQRKDHEAFVIFAMEDPEHIIEGQHVDFPELDRLLDFIKGNHDILKARLRGEWIEMEE